MFTGAYLSAAVAAVVSGLMIKCVSWHSTLFLYGMYYIILAIVLIYGGMNEPTHEILVLITLSSNKALVSLRNADPPEPSLLAYTKFGCR